MIDTDNEFVIFKQISETLNFCAYDIEKVTREMIIELRECCIISCWLWNM